jgi:hypothetical protein
MPIQLDFSHWTGGPAAAGTTGLRTRRACQRPLDLPPNPNPMERGGPLLHLRQIHDRPENGPRERERVVRSQQRVFDELLAAEPGTVFVEGLSGAVSPPEFSGDFRLEVQIVFRGYAPGQKLSLMQRRLLVAHGADFVYAHLYADVELRGTVLKTDHEPLEQYVASNLARTRLHGFNDEDRALLFTGREQRAVSLIAEWREKHPDELAALVFGAEHDFTPYEEALKSRLQVVDARWPADAHYTSEDFLDDLIASNPDHVAARLERGRLSDIEYVVHRGLHKEQPLHVQAQILAQLAQLMSQLVAPAEPPVQEITFSKFSSG